jgi:hypothetical protein
MHPIACTLALFLAKNGNGLDKHHHSAVHSKTRIVTASSNTPGNDVQHPVAAFNGGKMMHIFKADDTNPMAWAYFPEYCSDEAEQALKLGRLFYKIDGSNGMIMVDRNGKDDKNPVLRAYERFDTRGKPFPENHVPIPDGLNDKRTYCYIPIDVNVHGKKAKQRNQAMLDVVEANADRILQHGQDFVSIEWVGKKFNGTPNVPHDVAVAIHDEQVCEEPVERSFEGLRSFLLEESDPPVEGLVVEWQGKWWKVISKGFDRNCRFKKEKQTARAPVFLTV